MDLYQVAADELQRGLNADFSDRPMTDSEKKDYEETKRKMTGNLQSLVSRMENLKIEIQGLERLPTSSANPLKTPVHRRSVPNPTTYTKFKRPSIPDVVQEPPPSYSRAPISNIPSSSSTMPRRTNSSQVPFKPRTLPRPTSVHYESSTTRNIRKPVVRSTSTTTFTAKPKQVSKKSLLPPTSEAVGTLSLNLPGYDQALIHQIMDNIVDKSPTNTGISFEDIAGQETAKQALREMIVLPSLNPDLFQGLLSPPKGLLLFGPPGNGKTLLAKAVAAKTDSTFLCITASTLTSKWVGEGEKLVKALFAVAKKLQPSVIFVDEIDSILRERKETEHEASRRLKTEFFIEMDGVKNDSNDRIIIIGATNRPQELDEAILRRFSKRIYVGLPDHHARKTLLKNLMSTQVNSLTHSDLEEIAKMTVRYSGSDLTGLAKEAALNPLRELTDEQLKAIDRGSIRGIRFSDFVLALKSIRPSLTMDTLDSFQKWNEQFGVCPQ